MQTLDAHGRPDPISTAEDAEQRLVGWLHAAESVLIGFSGGVDSAYLACVAVEALGAERVLAVIGRSTSYPEVQWTRARNVAQEFRIPVLEVDTDELQDPRYAANPTNRCYFCKSELWHVLTPIARERALAWVIDGTNADDLSGHRPGAAAAREQGVRSPLAEVGMTKAEIRERSRARSIPTWDQPASPCLASRIPYGTEVTSERLRLVECAEEALRELGIRGDLRVRLHGPLARVEMSPQELEQSLIPARAAKLLNAVVSAGFERGAIDLAGFRSGSFNAMVREGTPHTASPNVDALTARLHEQGVPLKVTAHGSLAVLHAPWQTDSDSDPTWPAGFAESVTAIAYECGFTHAALELYPSPGI
jgi:uncharacterized protein